MDLGRRTPTFKPPHIAGLLFTRYPVIELVIGILLAISTHTACDLGKPVDYYTWVNTHPDYSVAHEFNFKGYKPVWLMTSADDPDIYLFEFKELDALNGGKNQHGDCFQDLGVAPQ